MSEFLRAFRLGTVNLFGIAIPGFLLLFFATIGLLIPAQIFILNYNEVSNWHFSIEWYNSTKWFMIGTFVLISYVVGFILRLTSPDKLDGISIEVCDSPLFLNGDKGVRFPYLRLGPYLRQQGHDDLQNIISWDISGCSDDSIPEKVQKCSNTTINRLKAEISFKCPELAATVESNEAHIRLMSGTWLAIRTTLPLVGLGAFICLYVSIPLFKSYLNPTFSKCLAYYHLQLVSNTFLIVGMIWSNKKIERLFHPRRVGELLFILQAVFLARQSDNSDTSTADNDAEAKG